MQDKDPIIQAKAANINSLTKELKYLHKKKNSLQEFKQKETDLQNRIVGLKEELKEKDFEQQQALLDFREDLAHVQELTDTQNDRQDKIRNTIED